MSSRRITVPTGRFDATDENGAHYTVVEYTTTVTINPIPGFQPRTPPFKTYETTEGLPVRWTGADVLTLPDGKTLRRRDLPRDD